MKKNLLLAGMLCISAIAFGQTSVDMLTGNAGTLATKIAEADRATVTDLTIKGEINAVDFKFMRNQLPALTKLNMEEVDITQYTGTEGTYPGTDEVNYYAQYIPENAFDGTENLAEVIFPKNLMGIKYCAFVYSKLEKADFSNTKLEKIDGGSSFFGCQELESVILPASLIYIASGSFSGADKLKSFTLMVTDLTQFEEVPEYIFGQKYEDGWLDEGNPAPEGCTLFVPKGSVEAYTTALGKIFSNIQEIGSVVKTDPTVSFTEATVTKKDIDAKFTNTLVNPDGVEVAYSSNDETVATVDAATGEVTILKDGTTTITATTVETEAFNSIQVSYVLTVTKGSGIDNVASSVSIEMVSDGIQLQFEGAANIEVYTVNGVMIEKTTSTDNCHIPLNKGMYLVKINNDLHKVVR